MSEKTTGFPQYIRRPCELDATEAAKAEQLELEKRYGRSRFLDDVEHPIFSMSAIRRSPK